MKKPPVSIQRKINLEGAKAAGPLLHGWARRTSRSLPSTNRQIRALATYMPLSSAEVYASLGGDETLTWAQDMVSQYGFVDPAPEVGPDEILVLGLPYGGPNGGKDDHGQFFSPLTEFMDGVLDNPPVMYTHGTTNGFEAEPVGSTTGRWYDQRGGWFKVKLDPSSSRYAQMIEANRKGTLRASTGVIPAAYHAEDSGHIDTWLAGELSLVDMTDGWKPVNVYAVTKAVSDTLFTDYYGDPVKEGNIVASIIEELRGLLTRWSSAPEPEPVDDSHTKAEVDPVTEPAEEIAPMDGTEEKCESCDEAKRLADGILADLDKPAKCARCPEAVTWVGSMLKAGRMSPTEARGYLNTFVRDDADFETVKATVEARPAVAAVSSTQKADLYIAGGTIANDDAIDPVWMEKQRKLAGIK